MLNSALSMPTKLNAEQLLRGYAAVQQGLCDALFDQYPIDDVNLLTDLPKYGSLSLDEGFWEFGRHGLGVCFTQVSTREIVDAQVEIFAHPAGFDASRLLLNLESKNIVILTHGTKKFDTTNEKSLDEMLGLLCDEGLLVIANPKRHLYSLA